MPFYDTELDSINYAHFITFISNTYNVNEARFRALYGTALSTAAILFIHAVPADKDIKPIHILYFLHWIKEYSNVASCSAHWGVDEKTHRKYCYKVLVALFITLNTISFIKHSIVHSTLVVI